MPADGILIEGFNVECDESDVTGESDAVSKDENTEPFLVSGTKVIDGTGSMLVVAVGCHSFHGRMLAAMQEESSPTPLQIKLAILADTIAKLGAAMALLMFLVLTIKYIVQLDLSSKPLPSATQIVERMLTISIETITVVVVAVPEGLPMAVTLALAYATTRMLQDNNLVRVLAACETMGNATCICSDKTGTLTENHMTVVQALVGSTPFKLPSTIKEESKMALSVKSEELHRLLINAIAVNSTAFEHEHEHGKTFVGNRTEVALLQFILCYLYPSLDYIAMREDAHTIDVFPFSSARKSMTTVVQLSGGNVMHIYVKGASEVILAGCTHWFHDGHEEKITAEDLRYLRRFIAEMAEASLRTISVAYREIPSSQYLAWSSNRESKDQQDHQPDAPPLEELTLLALVGIEDPLRPGVAESVEKCQQAGIFVRMVTGDNTGTAQAIARKCGILMRGGLVMEGARFRSLDEKTLKEILPRLQVLARSTPLDKQILVKALRGMGEVVAVTGDGSNDGPALRSANVGFAMGMAGTEVAKEASSIVLLDDNFASIVRAVSWGRCVNDSVRKFLQFQLTVNVSAVLIAFISAVIDSQGRSILTAVQLLWVNLIMDTLAALALATDTPAPEILQRPPESSRARLVTSRMTRMIIGQAIFQVATILLFLYYGKHLLRLSGNDADKTLATFIFNTFVFLQLANELNCRIVYGGEFNPFRDILTNRIFLIILVGTFIVQVMLVTFGGRVFGTVPLPLYCWLVSILVGLIALPLGLILRLLPDKSIIGAATAGEVTESERIVMTRERLHWQAAIGDVRRSLAFYSAIRRSMKPSV